MYHICRATGSYGSCCSKQGNIRSTYIKRPSILYHSINVAYVSQMLEYSVDYILYVKEIDGRVE
jgi:hypothetical protein